MISSHGVCADAIDVVVAAGCAALVWRSNGSETGRTKLKSCTSKPAVPTRKSRFSATVRL